MIAPTVFDPEEIDYFDVERQHSHDGIKFLSDLGYEEVFKIESQKTHRDYIFVKK